MWKDNPTTRKVMYLLECEMSEVQDRMSKGGTVAYGDAEKTAMLQSHDVGYLEGIKQIFDLEGVKDEQ